MSAIDVLIIGSGMGGATLAHALAPSGRRIVVLERGERLQDTPEARDADAIFARGHFRPDETWLTPDGTPVQPRQLCLCRWQYEVLRCGHAALPRGRFRADCHMGGTTPGWPYGYDTLARYYARAETLYQVRGKGGLDPTEPPRDADYPHPHVPHEPTIADLAARLASVGITPSPIPLSIDLPRWLSRAATPWDAFPDTGTGKIDAETILDQALQHPNVTLRTGIRVTRLLTDGAAITGVETTEGPISAQCIVLAAGAVHTAALLLRSATTDHPNGLANSSDQVGRNFMNHNASGLLALSLRRNRSVYQKTILINDWYQTGGPNGEPLGNVQLLGRVSGPILASQTGLPKPLAKLISAHAIDFYVMSEDLPDPESRVTIKGDDIVLNWRRSNWDAHVALVAKLSQTLKRAGYPVVLSKAFDRRTPSHQCGTARLGEDPACSVTDTHGRTHDHPNLFICDCLAPADLGGGEPVFDHCGIGVAAGRSYPGGRMTKTALITGGQQGIGLGAALSLHAAGWQVALAAEAPPDAPNVVSALQQMPGATYHQHDISDIDSIPCLFDAIGPVTTLISNAGVGAMERGDILDMQAASFDRCHNVNLRGGFFLIQECARRMIATPAEAYRSISIITSVSAEMISPDRAEYAISKAGAAMMAKGFATRLAPDNIGVFDIRPGIIESPMTAPVADRYTDRIPTLVPSGRWGTPGDIAQVILALARGDFAFATGAVIPVDGGLSIHRL